MDKGDFSEAREIDTMFLLDLENAENLIVTFEDHFEHFLP